MSKLDFSSCFDTYVTFFEDRFPPNPFLAAAVMHNGPPDLRIQLYDIEEEGFRADDFPPLGHRLRVLMQSAHFWVSTESLISRIRLAGHTVVGALRGDDGGVLYGQFQVAPPEPFAFGEDDERVDCYRPEMLGLLSLLGDDADPLTRRLCEEGRTWLPSHRGEPGSLTDKLWRRYPSGWRSQKQLIEAADLLIELAQK